MEFLGGREEYKLVFADGFEPLFEGFLGLASTKMGPPRRLRSARHGEASSAAARLPAPEDLLRGARAAAPSDQPLPAKGYCRLVGSEIAVDHRFDAEVHGGVLATPHHDALSEGGVIEPAFDCRGECACVTGWNEDSGLAAGKDIDDAPDLCCDDRRVDCERFQQGQSEPFPARGRDEQVGRCNQVDRIRARSRDLRHSPLSPRACRSSR